MENTKKDNFGSRMGFILAAAGSAVGLGNIWRFPYLAAKYGGGIFLIVYIGLAVTFGFALMITEIALGRRTGKSVIGAYKTVNRKFSFLGPIAAIVPFIITPYYCVIGGWVLKYLVTFITANGQDAAGEGEFFTGFIGQAGQPMLFFIIFAILTAAVVILGVQKGIEKISKLLMPLLVLIIVGIAIYTLTLPGALDGVKYYLLPSIDGFTATDWLKTLAAAMGQLFYSMSLAMGIMVTYGSYMRKEDSIEKSVRSIEIFDTAIAVLAGLIVVPSVFAFSGGNTSQLNAGPSLMFITLPNVFDSMKGGQIIGSLFFMLVALAALTSSISLLETMVSIISEVIEKKKSPDKKNARGTRTISTIIALAFVFVFGALSVFGYSIWDKVTIFGYQILDFFDFISNNMMMPIVAFITCILIGYIAKTKYIEDEVLIGEENFKAKKLYRVMIKFICPVCMIIILITPFVVKL